MRYIKLSTCTKKITPLVAPVNLDEKMVTCLTRVTGRPKKSELVHTDVTGVIFLAECRDEEGGIEVGLALSRKNTADFTAIWEQSLKLFLISIG
jgi:hypothetical protein